MNLIKKVTSAFFVLSIAMTALCCAEESTQQSIAAKIEREINCEKLNKAKKKFFKKIKASVSEKNEANVVKEISKSQLTDTQKAALLEVLDTVKAEAVQFPDQE